MTASPFDSDNIRGRVLLLEDASVFREMQCLLFQRAGYAVTVCDHLTGALAETVRQKFDVAVLNSDATGIDRPEFIQGLRRSHPALAIVYIAGALTVELTRDLTALGVRSVLQRPVNPIALMQKVDEAMGITVQPGASRIFVVPNGPAGSDHSAPPFGINGHSLSPFSSEPVPPFSAGSISPFSAPDIRPPFRTESASPFGARPESASPFRYESASPFLAARSR